MASGVLGGDEAREKKRRFPESNKVYSRKNPKKPKNSHHVSLPHHQTLTTEDNNFDAVASEDDSSSHNRNARELDNGNAAFSRYERIALDSMRRSEVGELRRKLVSELNQVRDSMKKIEAKEVRFASNSERLRGLGGSVVAENHDQQRRTPKGNPNMVKEKEKKKKLKSNADGDGDGDELDWNSSPVFKSSSDLLMKLMRHKFGWVFNKPVDAKGLGLHDYNTIVKHPMDLGTVKMKMDKNWYKSPREFAEDVRLTFSNAMLYNPKGQDVHFMAEQLAKVFEDQWKNVEAEFNRIRRIEMGRDAGLPTPASRKTPMLARAEMGRDAGLPTPPSRKTPMLPTPTSRKTPMPGRAKTGRDAGLPTPTSRKTPMLARAEMRHGADFPTPTSRKTPMLARGPAPAPAPAQAQAQAQAQDPAPSPPPPPPPVETRTLERSESRTMPVDPKLKPPGYGQLGRTTILKKPKAKDPDKRDMTYEEKQRLSLNLQSLPSDKLDNIVQIIKKRNPTLFQHDDEIEVDIASVDPETLWELDRFVTNYKKSLSKNKRKTEIAIQSEAEGEVETEAEGEGEAQVEAEVEAQAEVEVEVVEVEAEVEAEAEVEVVEAEVEVEVEAEAEAEVEAEAEAEAEVEVEVEVEVDSETDHAIPETNLAPAIGEATIETEAVENNVTEFNRVQEEKQGDNVSGSSSSSSSSSGSGSSSSDSDTDSSSASGSDADH